jgi:hypothetical protein
VLGPLGFGAFGATFVAYLCVLGLTRGLTSEPLLVRFSATTQARWRHGVELATGTTIVTAVLAGVLTTAVGANLPGPLGQGLVALGVVLPGLLLQDSLRYAFFAGRQGLAAFILDLVWGLLLFPSLAVAIARGHSSVALVVYIWGGTAFLTALVGYGQARLRPRPEGALRWLREQHDLAPRYVAEFTAIHGTGQLMIFGIGAVAGLEALGSFSGALILLGPLNAVCQGLVPVMIPKQVSIARDRPELLLRRSLWLSGMQAAGALVYAGLAWHFTAGNHWTLLGSVSHGAHEVLLPLGLAVAGWLSMGGPGVTLRALAAARRSLRAGLVMSLLTVVGGIGGAILGGAQGAATGLAFAWWLAAAVWWHQLLRALTVYAPPPTRSGSPARPVERIPAPADGAIRP